MAATALTVPQVCPGTPAHLDLAASPGAEETRAARESLRSGQDQTAKRERKESRAATDPWGLWGHRGLRESKATEATLEHLGSRESEVTTAPRE